MITKQLFQEIAIDPDSFVLDEVVNAVRYEINVFNSRLISEVTNSWMSQVQANVKMIDDFRLKKKIESLLTSKFRNNFYKNPNRKSHLNGNNWLNAVVDSNNKLRFDAIVTQNIISDSNVFSELTFDSFLDQSKAITGSINVQDLNSIEILFKQIEPFLILNKRLVIVNNNQWLISSTSTKTLFLKLFDFWNRNGGKELTIIRSLNPNLFSADKWEIEVEEINRMFKYIQFGGKFKFLAVEDSQKKTHKRALIGTTCGINAEYGLEFHGKSKKQIWDVMTKSTHDSLYSEFFENEIALIFPKFKFIRYINGIYDFGENF